MYRINLVYGLNSLTLGRLAPQHSVVDTSDECGETTGLARHTAMKMG